MSTTIRRDNNIAFVFKDSLETRSILNKKPTKAQINEGKKAAATVKVIRSKYN